jgi:PhnB protein
MATTLKPYIFFYGRCQEAIDFYKGVFGGDAEVMRVKDSPMAAQSPAEAQDLVMHASFTSGAIEFFAADGRDVKAIDPDAGNISLALSFDEAASAERVFGALAQGGRVAMPLEAAFWGGRFGMLVDKFGNEWMVTAP